MTQTREKWDSHILSGPGFWMVWRRYGILCIHLYFILLYFILFIYLFIFLEETLGKDT